MNQLISKIVKVLDGNKSILCLMVMSWLGTDVAIDMFSPDVLSWLQSSVLVLTGGAVGHHIVKGKLGSGSN